MAGTLDPDTMREAVDERAGQFAAAKAWLKDVVETLPGHRDDVNGMLRRLDVVNAIADDVHAMVKAGDREHAPWTLEFKFDPALVDAATSMNRLIDILGGGQSRAAMDAAAARKAWTYRMLLAVLIGGTLATVILAMWLAHRAVARPLHRLAAVSRQFAQGEFEAPIEGLGRDSTVMHDLVPAADYVRPARRAFKNAIQGSNRLIAVNE